MKNIANSTISMIALAILAPAAEPGAKPEAKPAAEIANGDDARQLEEQMMGYWAPDAEAMVKLIVEKQIMPKEDAQAVAEQSSKITFHVELGKVHVYTEQGVMVVKIKIDGEKAVATQEGEDKPLKLIKKAGSWKIAADSMLADSVKLGDTPADLKQAVDKEVKMFQAMAHAHKKVMPMIGKEGKTAADINKEIGQAMMNAFFENMPAPKTSGRLVRAKEDCHA